MQIRKISCNKDDNIVKKSDYKQIRKNKPTSMDYQNKYDSRNLIESTNEKKMRECTFSPKINPNSERIISQSEKFTSNEKYQK